MLNMRNISLRGENILLHPNQNYIVIDALYLDSIRDGIDKIDLKNLITELREKVFPYTTTPFAEYTFIEKIFRYRYIRKFDYRKYPKHDRSVFSTDTSLLAFVNKKILNDFVPLFDFGELVDTGIEYINFPFWDSIITKFDFQDIGLISGQGINLGLEFESSGVYQIVI